MEYRTKVILAIVGAVVGAGVTAFLVYYFVWMRPQHAQHTYNTEAHFHTYPTADQIAAIPDKAYFSVSSPPVMYQKDGGQVHKVRPIKANTTIHTPDSTVTTHPTKTSTAAAGVAAAAAGTDTGSTAIPTSPALPVTVRQPTSARMYSNLQTGGNNSGWIDLIGTQFSLNGNTLALKVEQLRTFYLHVPADSTATWGSEWFVNTWPPHLTPASNTVPTYQLSPRMALTLKTMYANKNTHTAFLSPLTAFLDTANHAVISSQATWAANGIPAADTWFNVNTMVVGPPSMFSPLGLYDATTGHDGTVVVTWTLTAPVVVTMTQTAHTWATYSLPVIKPE